MSKLVHYDKGNDLLSIHAGFSPDEKFKGNIDVGDLIIDISTKGRVRGIEILNASTFFRDFGIKHLENLTDATITSVQHPDSIFIGITLKLEGGEEIPAKIAVPLTAPAFR